MQASKLALVALPVAWVALLTVAPRAAQEQSVNGGVYTDAQAARGAETYGKECASCHGAGLEGDGFAPALSGAEFLSNWNGTTVGDLFDRIRISMPPGNPNGVPAQAKADIVAHVLKANKYPAGAAELAKDLEPLKQIKLELPK
ncbi:MAG: c-type cytochrome [Vicinamibacterales bacterium]